MVQARADDYAKTSGARLVPFGVDLPEAITRLTESALETGLDPDEVWCAAGSGVLARALAQAWEILGLDPGMTTLKGPGRVVFWNVAGPARS